jgi:hypothetical protein
MRSPLTAEVVAAGATIATHEGAVPAPDTSLGSVRVVPPLEVPDFQPGGTVIHARLNTCMGIEVVVKGGDDGSVVALRTRVSHPPILNPSTGKTTTVDAWDSPMNIGIPRYAGWIFDHPWELVPGTWTIAILDGHRILTSRNFTVSVEPATP